MIDKSTKIKSASYSRLIIPISVGVAMFIITIVAWGYVRSQTDFQQQLTFTATSEEITRSLEQRIAVYSNALNATRAFFAASDDVTLEDWITYSNALELSKNFSGISGLNYLVYLKNDELRDFESKMNKIYTGWTDFKVHPKTDSNEHFIVKYSAPYDDDHKVGLGFDSGSNPDRLASLRKSGETDTHVTTPVVKSTITGLPVFSIYTPVYERTKSLETAKQRQEALLGFVSASFRTEELFKTIFTETQYEGIDFAIVDNKNDPAITPEEVMFHHGKEKDLEKTLQRDSEDTIQFPVHVPGRSWQIYLREIETDKSFYRQDVIPLIILTAGTLLSFLLFWLLYSLAASRTRAVKVAEVMTQNLRSSEKKYRDIFESFQDVLYRTDVDGKIVMISPSIEKYVDLKSSEVIGMNANDFYTNQDERTTMMSQLHAQGYVSDFILTLKGKGEDVISVSLNAHLLLDQNGSPTGVEGVLRDVSERSKESQAEKQRAKELERLNKLMVDRELKMVELKNELKKYKGENNG